MPHFFQTIRSNSNVYKIGPAAAEASPLTLVVAKSFMKVTSTADDALIQSMINACTEWGEKYTGRDFRVKTWTLFLDFFPVRIVLNRDPVESVTSVKYLVATVLTTVDNTIYYLKKLTQCSEIILFEDKEWPTDIDDREQSVEVEFKTESYFCTNEILEALKRHVLFLYENRGDCSCDAKSANDAGVSFIYNQFRIPRI